MQVLNTEVVCTGSLVGTIVFGIVAIFLLAAAIWEMISGDISAGWVFLIFSILISLFVLMCWPRGGPKQYEVVISDTISFNEVASKYEIVERRGDIWVLRDRDDG